MSRQDYYFAARPARKRRSLNKPLIGALIVAVLGFAAFHVLHDKPAAAPLKNLKVATAEASAPSQASGAKSAAAAKPDPCAANDQPKLALVSIGQRHLWACDGTTVAYDSAVVTGMENLAADLTPTGTYHVYGKQTNLYLNGSDSTGSWHDHVYYWMPFLDNQYGAYGFHDATWRPADAFGNISPYSSNASHGCVELPLATAKWLYNWVAIGTPVTIES